MTKESQDFLTGINRKDEKMWKLLYTDYYSPLCCYALKILKDREQAMDVVQGVIIRLWETKIYFENVASFRGYLYRAVYHNCLKFLRDRNIEERCLTKQDKDIFEISGFELMIEEEIVRKLRQVINRMPEKRREVILLCLAGKKIDEISDILSISINTVKKHKKEAYQFIRKVLSPDILILFYILLKN